MQTPTKKTPVSKCLDLAAYSIRMFEKFSTNVVLAGFAAEMLMVKNNLSAAQKDYENAVCDVLPARVDVKYENLVSDRRIRLTQQKIEMLEGNLPQRVGEVVFPEGSSPVIRLLGESQTQAMKDLEGKLEAAVALWPDASTEKVEIEKMRESYQNALDHRDAVGQAVRNKRVMRDAVKDVFITKYVEITNRVKAEFPRDTAMQDLFFDDVRTKSALAEADAEAGDDTETKTEEPATEPKPG